MLVGLCTSCIKPNPDFVESSSSDSTSTAPAESASSDGAADDPGGTGSADPTASTGAADPGTGDSSTGAEPEACDVQVAQEATPIDAGRLEPDQPGASREGNLGGGQVEEVWYVFEAGIQTTYTRVFASAVPSDSFEVCGFVDCVPSGGVVPPFVTCDGAAIANSPGGRPGCCGDGNFSLSFFCPGADATHADIRLRVGMAESPQACQPYALSFEVSTQ